MRKILFFLLSGIFLTEGCVKKNKSEESKCCGKVIFTVSPSDGRTTKITDCEGEEPVEFCFRIENPRFYPIDKSCKLKLEDINVKYIVDYGDGSTAVVNEKDEFCHTFKKGSYIVKAVSYPEIETCEYPLPYTGATQIGVIECLYPYLENLVNSCCPNSTYCEINVGAGCDLSIYAEDKLSQPLTYCWDTDGDNNFETCGTQTIRVLCDRVDKKIISSMVENACGCSIKAADFYFDCMAYVSSIISGGISFSLYSWDVYPQKITDYLFLYVSNYANVLSAPYLMIYHAPATEPWNLSLFDIHHGPIKGGELQFSNDYLHMNSPAAPPYGGVYVFSATFPSVLSAVSSPPNGGWKTAWGATFRPSMIYVEGITGFLIENNTAYLVDISNPLSVVQKDSLFSINNCSGPGSYLKKVFSILPFAFVSVEAINSTPDCGIGVYDVSDGYFGSRADDQLPSLIEPPLRKEGCSDSSLCFVNGLSGSKELLIENEFIEPVTYPSPSTAVLTLKLFTKGATDALRIFATDGSSTEEVTSANYYFDDKKRIVISENFYSTHPYPLWLYSVTYQVPSLFFAGISQGDNGYVEMWDVGSYPGVISRSEAGASYKISAIQGFSKGIVSTCSQPKPAVQIDQVFFDVFDFSDPIFPRETSSLELKATYKFSSCSRLRGFEDEGVRTGFVITGSEIGVIDISDIQNPSLKKTLYFSGNLMDIDDYLQFIILSVERAGLVIYDVSDAANPYFISSYQNGRIFDSSVIDGSFIYSITNEYNDDMTEKKNGIIEVIDISNLTSPSPVTYFHPSNGDKKLTCIVASPDEKRLYVGGVDYMGVIDISNPSSLSEISYQNLRSGTEIETALSCTYENGTLVVLTTSAHFHIFKTQPSLSYIGRFNPAYVGALPRSILLKDGNLYIGSRGYLTIYDLSIPEAPVFLSSTFLGDIYDQINDMKIMNNFIFLAVDYMAYDGVYIGYGFVYDVSNPIEPIKYAKFNAGDVNTIDVRYAGGGNYYIYLGASNGNILNLYKAYLTY
jgi:hypothetical protein